MRVRRSARHLHLQPHSLASPTPRRSEMARDLARVSAMDGMMWLGLVHCRRSFLQQNRVGSCGHWHACAKMALAFKRDLALLREPVARPPAVGKAAVCQRRSDGEIRARDIAPAHKNHRQQKRNSSRQLQDSSKYVRIAGSRTCRRKRCRSCGSRKTRPALLPACASLTSDGRSVICR